MIKVMQFSMKYRPTYYFNPDDIEEVIDGFLLYHNVVITEEDAIKLIKEHLHIFGQSFLLDKQVEKMKF